MTQHEGLDRWFQEAFRAFETAYRRLGGTDERTERLAQSLLERNATQLVREDHAPPAREFSATCQLLGAACLLLRVRPTAETWQAAVANERALRAQLHAAGPTVSMMLPTCRAAFKDGLLQAVINAGCVVNVPSPLASEPDREHALRLAISWALRFLVALGHDPEPGDGPTDPAFDQFRKLLVEARGAPA